MRLGYRRLMGGWLGRQPTVTFGICWFPTLRRVQASRGSVERPMHRSLRSRRLPGAANRFEIAPRATFAHLISFTGISVVALLPSDPGFAHDSGAAQAKPSPGDLERRGR